MATPFQAAGYDFADGAGRFNRRNSNFANESATAQDEHFRIRLHSLPASQIQDYEIVSLIYRQDRAAHAQSPSASFTALPLFLQFGRALLSGRELVGQKGLLSLGALKQMP